MKIMVVVPELCCGGAERVLSILSNHFVIDNEVTIILTKGETVYYKLDENIKLVCNNGKRSAFGQIKFIRKMMKKLKPDITISFFTFQNIYTLIAKTGLRRKVIISERNDPSKSLKTNKKIYLKFRNFMYKKAYKVVFQTVDAQKYYPKKIQKKSVLINNPIFIENIPYWTGIESKSIVTACRINKQKNLTMLFDAMKIVNQKYPDYVLEIYGDNNRANGYEQYIHEYIKTNNIGNVYFMGKSDQIFEVYKKSFIFCLTSNYEGMSNSMIEALCVGIPVICTDCPIGAPRMFIKDNVNGFLVSLNDHEGLAKKIIYCIENKEELQKIHIEELKNRELFDSKIIIKEWNLLIK